MMSSSEFATRRISHMPVGSVLRGRRKEKLILLCAYSRSEDKPIGRQDKPTGSARSCRARFHIARVDGATLAVWLRAGLVRIGGSAIRTCLFTLEGRDGAAIQGKIGCAAITARTRVGEVGLQRLSVVSCGDVLNGDASVRKSW